MTAAEAGIEYDEAVTGSKNLPNYKRPIEILTNPENSVRINRADYMATRPDEIAAKAAGMYNGAASAAHGGLVGDGVRFRGRGFLQITGRKNYKWYGDYSGHNFTDDPNNLLLASDDFNACDAAGYYWAREKVNSFASQGSSDTTITQVGSLVNRGRYDRITLHNPERQAAFRAIWGKINDVP
jgi:hydroxyethylthiazole kinase